MTERPCIIVDTPFGQMRAVFNHGGQITLADTSDNRWSTEHNCYLNSGSPISINRVQYHARFTCQKDRQTGEWVETNSALDKPDSVKAFNYSSAALRKFREIMPTVCADLAEKHADLLRAAEIARLTDACAQANQLASRLFAEYQEAETNLKLLQEELRLAEQTVGQLIEEREVLQKAG